MKESFKAKLTRWGFNFFPVLRRTGGRLTYLANDFYEVHVKLPLNWKTRNYVGTIYGGCMFSSVDGLHAVMLIKILGRDYIVWDKEGKIRFRKPGRSTLYAKIKIEKEDVEQIKKELLEKPSVERVYPVNFVDQEGVVHASIEKTVHIKKKPA